MNYLGKSDSYAFVPDQWEPEFHELFLKEYESHLKYGKGEPPDLDELTDFLSEFFYEAVSFYTFDGDRYAYTREIIDEIERTDEAREDFYEYAQNHFFWDFHLDIKTFVSRNHICIESFNEGYLNMPIKEVW